MSRICYGRASRQSVGRSHGYTADGIVTDMLGNLNRQRSVTDLHRQRIIDCRQMPLVKANVNDGSHYLSYASCI